MKEFEEATKRGKSILNNSAKAKKVSFDSKAERLVIELENGVVAMIPSSLIQIFQQASPDQISDVKVAVEGLYLRWEKLDEDLFVPNLLQGIFGTKKWMDSLKEHLSKAGKKGGSSCSEAKQNSSRENGKKGGRPKKAA